MPIINIGKLEERPVVFMPARSKWYHVCVDYHGGRIEEVGFPDEGNYETLGSPYVDHVPNPRHVVAWARRMGFRIDSATLEVLVGRWELECTDRWDDMLDEG